MWPNANTIRPSARRRQAGNLAVHVSPREFSRVISHGASFRFFLVKGRNYCGNWRMTDRGKRGSEPRSHADCDRPTGCACAGGTARKYSTTATTMQCLPETRRQGFQVHGMDEEEVDGQRCSYLVRRYCYFGATSQPTAKNNVQNGPLLCSTRKTNCFSEAYLAFLTNISGPLCTLFVEAQGWEVAA